MKTIEWDDKFIEQFRYDSTIDYDIYIKEVKENVEKGLYALIEHSDETYTVLYDEVTPRGKELWIEFGHSDDFAGSSAIDDILEFARSHDYVFVNTNCEKKALADWYAKKHKFNLTHYQMELKL